MFEDIAPEFVLYIAASAHRKQVAIKTASASTLPSTSAIARDMASFRSGLLTSRPNPLKSRMISLSATSG